MRTRKSAFTLVELLVVIGIIAVLISLLLPSLNRARESARQTQCLSNIRQISQAFFMYTNENKGWFPAAGVFGAGLGQQTVNAGMSPTWVGRAEDWIVWRNKQPDDPLEGSIVPYMNNPPAAAMRCPSDQDPTARVEQNVGIGGPYVYSYAMNSYLSFGAIYHPLAAGALATAIQESPDQGWNNIRFKEDVAWKITQVKSSSEKVIVYEVDERFLRDGRAQMQSPPVGMSAVNMISMVAIRHDAKRVDPDPAMDNGQPITNSPNVDKRGNCGFVDGHAEYLARRDAHSRRCFAPKYSGT